MPARKHSSESAAKRILIDVRKIADSGIGTYISNVVPGVVASMPEVHCALLGDPVRLRSLFGGLPNAEIIPCAVKPLSMKEQVLLPRYIPPGIDLFWATHFNIPLAYRGPLLATIHDIMPMAVPSFSGGHHHAVYVRLMMSAIRRRHAGIISVSQFTTSEIVRLTGIPKERITTILEGVDGSWSRVVPATRPRVKPYLLYVGLVKPHKNLLGLLHAFEKLAPHWPHDLVIIGDRDKIKTRDEASEQFACRFGERVVFTGWVTQADLEQYLAHADALVFPSLYEGFGLPALEAMACGCPVIASRAASLPEVCGDAALYFDGRDPADMAEVLGRCLGDPALRDDMRSRGRTNAAQFRWDDCAEQTAAVVRSMLRHPARQPATTHMGKIGDRQPD